MASVAVTWYGHSNMYVEADGVSLLIDPFFEGNPQAPDWKSVPSPHIILLTHSHGDHLGQAIPMAQATGAQIACIADLADWLQGQGVPGSQILNYGSGWNIGGMVEHEGVRMTMTQAIHSTGHGTAVGYIVELPGGYTLYHAGDTSLFGDMRLMGEEFDLDLAMVPTGGVFTMDGKAAAKACAWVKAKAAMPVHYGTFPILAQETSQFAQALGKEAPNCKLIAPAPGVRTILVP